MIQQYPMSKHLATVVRKQEETCNITRTGKGEDKEGKHLAGCLDVLGASGKCNSWIRDTWQPFQKSSNINILHFTETHQGLQQHLNHLC